MIKQIPIQKLRKARFLKLAGVCSLDLFQHGAFLAGGALRTLIADEEISDYDIFFSRLEPEVIDATEHNKFDMFDLDLVSDSEPSPPKYLNVEAVKRILEKERFKQVFACSEGKLFTYTKGAIKIQLILENSSYPEDMIGGFDFGACCAAFDGNFFYYSKAFIRDVKTKKLSINAVTYPAATIKRMVKYAKKGYNISEACVEFMKHISGQVFDEEKLRLYID